MYKPSRVFICLLALYPFSSFSLENLPAEIKVNSSKTEIHIGDQFHYTIETTHPKHVTVLFPEIGRALGDIEVLESAHHTAPLEQTENVKEVMDLLLTAYKLGTVKIPSLELTLVDKNGTKHEAVTPSASITVKSVLEGEDAHHTSLRDIKPVLDIDNAQKTRASLVIIALISGLVCLAVLYLRFKKIRERPPLSEPGAEVVTPEEEALREIEKLWASRLFRKKVKLFYATLAHLIKEYLEKRYHLKTRERTTREIVSQMLGHQLDKALVKQTQKVFKICDLVKFSKYDPTEDESKWLVQQAASIIRFEEPMHTQS